jgi:holo-[acyl-carrier protein] synthase
VVRGGHRRSRRDRLSDVIAHDLDFGGAGRAHLVPLAAPTTFSSDMPLRIGFDLESPARVAESLATHGERYLQRVYTTTEISDCRRAGAVDPRSLAARFAAKEAAFKMVGVGAAAASWQDVEVLRAPSDELCLLFRGHLATLAKAAGMQRLSLSLSYTHGLAAAIVIASVSG